MLSSITSVELNRSTLNVGETDISVTANDIDDTRVE